MRDIAALLLFALALGCSSCGRNNGGDGAWNGHIQVNGSIRDIHHLQKIGATAALDTILPDPEVYGVGAMAELNGEITIFAGQAFLTYPDALASRTEVSDSPNAAATLLITSRVPVWRTTTTRTRVAFDELDEEIVALAETMGFTRDDRFPFMLEGFFEDLNWHVVDGSRLVEEMIEQDDHLAAAARLRAERAEASMIGFYSPRDQGVFTHAGSVTHIHCVIAEPLMAGHVDDVVVPAGTTVMFPVPGGE